MEITEKWLGEIGGWEAMKAARMLVAAGKVHVTERTSDTIRGHVGGEKSRLTSGLLVRTRSDVENLCTCLSARRTGLICEHSIAVGLASLAPDQVKDARARAFGGVEPPTKFQPTTEPLKATTAPGQLSLFLPEVLLDSGTTGKGTTAFLKLEAGETENSKLASWLVLHGVTLQNTPLSLPPSKLGSLLKAIVDHPRVYIGKPGLGMHRPLVVSETKIRPLLRVQFTTDTNNPNSWITLRLSESPVPQMLATGAGEVWLYRSVSQTIHPWKADMGGELEQISKELLWDGLPAREISRPVKWMPANLGSLEDLFQVELDSELQNRYRVVYANPRFTIQISGTLQNVQIRVVAEFQNQEWQITSKVDPFPIQDQMITTLFYARDIKLEQVLFDQLNQLGFRIDGVSGLFTLHGNRQIMLFFGSGLPKLNSNYTVTFSADWIRATEKLHRISPTVNVTNGTMGQEKDWLTMELAYEAPNGFRISRSDVLRLIRSGQSTIKSKDGRQYVLDCDRCEEFEETLQDVPVQLTPDGVRVGRVHESYFLPFASRATLAATRDIEIDINEWKSRLGTLGLVLRSYQIEGVAWTIQRLKAGQGALLGDDMGLGKTIQSIAVIQLILNESANVGQQALIVCPKSLIGNWQAEFKKFAPKLRVLAVQGANRNKLTPEFDSYDVLITSYSLISRDLPQYLKSEFSVGVFDESSFLRNPDTETAKAVRQLRLRARLALSGTPVENGARDLWSIFEILLPGYLGNRQTFQQRFEKPLVSQSNEAEREAAATRLRRLVRPFFLRRIKRDVLKELPEKIEQVFWCEMSETQTDLYRTILEEGREEIRVARRRSGQNGARMTMLTVLLRLRQVCCDVNLVGLAENRLSQLEMGERSGKWSAFDELLNGVIAGGGKALVFSQFVSFLGACREHLNSRGIGYAYLDGGTQDRTEQVQNFQTDSNKPVFLISLKAGGYGLNLTKADHVFLMDPWWNPAVEAQAIDRAHRYGQNRVVNAYRLVMRGTIEERVLALQERKRGLISATIEDRSPMMEGLKDSDLEELLDI